MRLNGLRGAVFSREDSCTDQAPESNPTAEQELGCLLLFCCPAFQWTDKTDRPRSTRWSWGTGDGEGGGEESRGMKHLRRGTADLVDSFPVAAVTNYHKPSGLNHTNLLPHGSGTTSTTHSVHSLARTSSMVTLSWEMKVCGPETGSQPVVSVTCHGTTSLEETGSFQMETNRCFAIKRQE